MIKLLVKITLVVALVLSIVSISPASGEAATVSCYQFNNLMYYSMPIPEAKILIYNRSTGVNPEYTKYITDINKLHDVLEAEGFPIQSVEEKNKKFGKSTAIALVKLQIANASTLGESPSGILTEATRDVINQKYGCIKKATVSLTSPNSGIIKARGESLLIKWDASRIPNTTDLLIQYVTNQNTATTTIATKTGIKNGNGQHTWVIPNDIALGRYKIVVSLTGNTKSDRSDTAFEIREKSLEVLNPSVTPELAPGERYIINWKSSVGISKTRDIKINLVGDINSGGSVYAVNTQIAKPQNSGSYMWTVPDRIDGRIVTATSTLSLVLSTEDGVHVSTSSNSIKLVPAKKTASSVTLTSPVEGQRFVVGQNLPIRWNTTGLKETDTVKISLVSTVGTTVSEYQIFANAKNDGQANWTIPATTTNANSVLSLATTTVGMYKISVTPLANTSTIGTSASFSITPTQAQVLPMMTVTSVPTSVERGIPFTVNWTTNSTVGLAGRIKIELVDSNSGKIVETLAKDVPAKTNTYVVTVPTGVPATNYQSHKLRLTPTSGFSSFDAKGSESANFKITTRSGQLTTTLDKTSVVRGNPIIARLSGSIPTGANITATLVRADQTPVMGVPSASATFKAGQISLLIPDTVPAGQYKVYLNTVVDTNPVNTYSAEFAVVNPAPVFSIIGNPTITKTTTSNGKTSSMKATFNFSIRADGVSTKKITTGNIGVVFVNTATGSTTQATSAEVSNDSVANGQANIKVVASINGASLPASSNFTAKINSVAWTIGGTGGTEKASLTNFVTPQITFVK